MEVKIRTKEYVDKVIKVEFPYYYRHDVGSDYGDITIFGIMDSDMNAIMIEEKFIYQGENSYTFSKHKSDGSYFDEKYKSNEKEFVDAFNRAVSFIESLKK